MSSYINGGGGGACVKEEHLSQALGTRKNSGVQHQKSHWENLPIVLSFLAAANDHWEKETASPTIQLHNSITTT